MFHANGLECRAHLVGLAVIAHDDGGGLRGVLPRQVGHELRHVVGLVNVVVAHQYLQVFRLVGGVVVALRKQPRVDAERRFSIFIEDVEQISRRAVVAAEVVDARFGVAAAEQCLKGLHLCAHKRENGLLVVAQIHHRESLIGGREAVDDGNLQGVEVLNFVHLNPVVLSQLPFRQLINPEQQVLEIEQVVLPFVVGISLCRPHHLHQLAGVVAQAEFFQGCQFFDVGIYLGDTLPGVRPSQDIAHGLHGLWLHGIGMNDELAAVIATILVHEMREVDGLAATVALAGVGKHFQLVAVHDVCQDADAVLLVNDRRLHGHDALLEKQF